MELSLLRSGGVGRVPSCGTGTTVRKPRRWQASWASAWSPCPGDGWDAPPTQGVAFANGTDDGQPPIRMAVLAVLSGGFSKPPTTCIVMLPAFEAGQVFLASFPP